MNLQQLQSFISVAEHESFTAAAQEQHISQPAISKQIRELELEYDCVLLDRTTHKVVLTEAGADFLKSAKEIVSIDRDNRNRMQYLVRSQKGQIKIAFLSDIRKELKKCLNLFCPKYPAHNLVMDQMRGSEMYVSLSENRYDFYFTLRRSLSVSEGYSWIPIRYTGLALIYPKKWEGEIDVSDLSTLEGKPFAYFLRRDGMFLYDHTMEVLKSRGFEPTITNYYNDADAAAFSPEAGVALTVLPEFMFREGELEDVCVEKIPGDDTLMENVIAWKSSLSSPSSLHFLEVIKELYGDKVRSTETF